MIATAIAWVIANPWTAAFIIASTSYAITQAKKMRKQMRDAAEARKGFEIVTAGDAQPIPIIYGRAKVGGTRVWHNSKSTHELPEGFVSNVEKVFDVGAGQVGQQELIYESYACDEGGCSWQQQTVLVPGISAGNLANSVSGSKNEFLYFQQVLCHGPISGVTDFVVDESRFSNDPDLGKVDGNLISRNSVKAGFRTEISFDGQIPNNLVAHNFGDRASARFPGLAYASTVIRLNRDDPQFQGSVPMVQYFVTGRKVRRVSNGTIVNSRVYSNNPAWCLLDYLLESSDRIYEGKRLFEAGKGLPESQLDLASFEQAAVVCDRIVAYDKPVFGNVWNATGSASVVSKRNIPLYECNIIIDPEKPIRENIEAILACMGDARLVWSAGKYKLSLQYPTSNEAIQLAATITDDDLVLGAKFELVWPTSSERLNHATVRFHNESENFKEDSVSWPPKQTGSYYKGVNGQRYPNSEDVSGELFDSYGVWQGTTFNPPPFLYRAVLTRTGNYVLEFRVDDNGTMNIWQGDAPGAGPLIFSQAFSGAGTVHRRSVSLQENVVYTIQITAVNTGGPGGVAARLLLDNFIFWNTRDPAYTAYELVQVSDAVYQQFLQEDSNLKLETSMFFDGCSDRYHALAKAEELVRTSRSAISISFEYLVQDKFLEPGDFIKIQSSTLSLGDEDFYVRVSEVKLSETGTCSIKGTRFDYTQLAWNVADDEYKTPPNIYGFTIPTPSEIVYTPITDSDVPNSSGRLSWAAVDFDSFAGYVLYYNTANDFDLEGFPIFKELGKTVTNEFSLPPLNVDSAIFAVRVVSKSNRYSKYKTTGDTAVRLPIIFPRTVEITAPSLFFVQQANSEDFVSDTIELTTTAQNYREPMYRWFVDNSLIVGANGSSLTVNAFTTGTSKRYRVEVYEASNEETQAEDYLTIYSIKEGSSGYTVLLSNESKQLVANYEGNVAVGQIPYQVQVTVLRGIQNITAGSVISLGSQIGLSATISSDIITVNEITATTANCLVNVQVDGVTISKLFYANKVIPGRSPEVLRLTSNRYGFPFEDSKSTTSLVPQVDFNIWLENIDGTPLVVAEAFDIFNTKIGEFNPVPDQNNAFVITAAQFNQFNSTETASVRVTASLEDLSDTVTILRVNNGENAYILNLENEAHLVPATFEGIVTDLDEAYTNIRVYKGFTEITHLCSFSKLDNGATSVITGQGTSSVLLSLTSLIEDLATVIVAASIPGAGPNGTALVLRKVFSVAKARDGDPGTPGAKSIVVYAFKVVDLTLGPPNVGNPGSTTYDFNARDFVPGLPVGWYQSPPDISAITALRNYKVFVTTATVIDETGDNLVEVNESDWSDAVPYTLNGISTASVFLYKRTETAATPSEPVTADNNVSVYSFQNRSLTNIPTGWSTEIPTKEEGQDYLWVSAATVASETETDSINGAVGNSEWSIPKLLAEKGEDATAFVGFLTNDSHVLSADVDGVVSDYDGATGSFEVYLNGLPAIGVTYAYVTSSGFSTAPTTSINETTGVYTITGTGSFGVIANGSNTATVTYSATVNNTVVSTHTFTISKAKAGADGTSPTLYRLESNTGAVRLAKTLDAYVPNTLLFNAFSKVGSGPWTPVSVRIDIEGSVSGSSWTQLATATEQSSLSHSLAATGFTYRFFRGLIKIGGVIIENEVIPVVVDGEDGNDGDYVSYVFKESPSQPITPSSTAVIPSGWLDAPPATYTESIWMSKATISGITGLAGTWSAPIKVTGVDGGAGAYTYYEYAINYSTTSSPTTGWTTTVPAVGFGEYLWLRTITVDPVTTITSTSNGFRATGERGTDGSPAYSIRIVASSQVFKLSKDGVVTPDYITLTAIRQNTTNTFNWSGATFRSSTNPSSSIVTTGTTVYLHKNDFVGASATVSVYPSFPTNIIDTIGISRVQEGLDSITVTNSNPTHQINAYAGGQSISMADSGTVIGVYVGATALSYSASVGVNGTFTITSILKNNITANNPTSGTIANHIAMLDSATEGSVTYNISYTTPGGQTGTIATVQTFTKNILTASVSLSATAASFSYAVDNSTPTPTTSTISATSVNVSSPYFVFKKGISTVQEGFSSSYMYTPASSYLNMPETITVQVYKDANKATVLSQSSLALNATRVGATGTGTAGAATFYIDRASSSSSAVPTDAEVFGAIGRYAVIGDLATISYNSGVNAISYRCAAPYPSASWSVKGSFLSGDLFVSGSITGDKIDTNTLTAKYIQTGASGTQRVTINEADSNEMYFYADRGDGTIVRLVTIGVVPGSGSDSYLIESGSSQSKKIAGFFKAKAFNAINAQSYKNFGDGDSTTGHGLNAIGVGEITGGVFAYASGGTNNTGVFGWSGGSSGSNQFSRGVHGLSTNGIGVFGEGATYDFYAGGAGSNYGPFTGSHDGLVDNQHSVQLGDIVIDKELLYKYNISSCLFRNELSNQPNQKGVIGVVNQIKPLTLESLPAALIDETIYETNVTIPVQGADQIINNRYRISFNALGEGQVNVCGENGNIEVGDLIVASSLPGKGMKQSDDIVRSYTVAKAREAVVFDSPTDVKQIACIYLCG